MLLRSAIIHTLCQQPQGQFFSLNTHAGPSVLIRIFRQAAGFNIGQYIIVNGIGISDGGGNGHRVCDVIPRAQGKRIFMKPRVPAGRHIAPRITGGSASIHAQPGIERHAIAGIYIQIAGKSGGMSE